MTNSGKSKSQANPFGKRRLTKTKKEMAPISLRKKGKQLLSDCSEKELKMAGVL